METMDTMDSWRNRSTTLVDLRKKPRYETLFPGEVTGANGECVRVTITNISRSGLRLEGNRSELARVIPSAESGAPHTPLSLEVRFSLTGPENQTHRIQVLCSSVYVLQGEYRDCKIGMQLTTLKEGEEAFLEYISFRAYGR